MVSAITAHEQVRLELAVKQHLFAARAFVPEILRDVLLGDDRPDLRQDEVGEPVHQPLATAFACRAPRTPRASAATSASTASTRPGLARLRSSSEAATRCTSAVPTTAASATRATSAACSAVLMPKPTATGSGVWRRIRATALATSAILGD